MKIGGGIFLMAVGAILAFAIQDGINGVDLTLVGYILLAAGFIVTVLAIVLATRSRTAVATTRTSQDPVTGEGVTQSERSIN
jgi:hypothetical protein